MRECRVEPRLNAGTPLRDLLNTMYFLRSAGVCAGIKTSSDEESPPQVGQCGVRAL
nr:AlNc14C115G6508 [Albugo laibachii Nc14]|eukprot:CCA21218.1 AlNc14C115G6508 [Albugo laibachii Nc14]